MTSKKKSARLIIAAIASAAALSAPAALAKTVRNHSGETALSAPGQLACGSFKYCAKVGVVVRDHRTGATPPPPGK